jgi:hypothetical protein
MRPSHHGHARARQHLGSIFALAFSIGIAQAQAPQVTDEEHQYELLMGPTVASDLPGPRCLRELAWNRRDSAGEAFYESWLKFLAGRGTECWMYQDSCHLLESQRGASQRPEIELRALEAHLRRMLERLRIDEKRFEDGRMLEPCEARHAAAEAKIWLAEAILKKCGNPQVRLERDELERLWTDLDAPDEATLCAARFTLLAAASSSEAFLTDRVWAVDDPCRIERALGGEQAAEQRRRALAQQLLSEIQASKSPSASPK